MNDDQYVTKIIPIQAGNFPVNVFCCIDSNNQTINLLKYVCPLKTCLKKNIFISMPGLSIFFSFPTYFKNLYSLKTLIYRIVILFLDHLYLKEFRQLSLSWKKAILFYFQFVEFKKKLNIFGLETNIYRIHSKMWIIKSVIHHTNLKLT